MNQPVETRAKLPTEELARITAEYRRGGFARQAPAVVVYHDPHVLCPWPGCNERIAGIVFQPTEHEAACLAEDWFEKAQIVPKPAR